MTETLLSFAAQRWGVTQAEAQHMINLRDLIRSREHDQSFRLGLQAWGVLHARQMLDKVRGGPENERWLAFGRAEEAMALDATVRGLADLVQKTEDAFERSKKLSPNAPPESEPEF
jgi:hypothetical protein